MSCFDVAQAVFCFHEFFWFLCSLFRKTFKKHQTNYFLSIVPSQLFLKFLSVFSFNKSRKRKNKLKRLQPKNIFWFKTCFFLPLFVIKVGFLSLFVNVTEISMQENAIAYRLASPKTPWHNYFSIQMQTARCARWN